jgi:hypothetical protein
MGSTTTDTRPDEGGAGVKADHTTSLGADILLMTVFARNCVEFPTPQPRYALEKFFRPAERHRSYSFGYFGRCEEDVIDNVFDEIDDRSTDQDDDRWSGHRLHRPGPTPILDALAEVCARDPGDVYAVAVAVRSGGHGRDGDADGGSRAAPTTVSTGSVWWGGKRDMKLTLAANRALDAETKAYVAELTRLLGALSKVFDVVRTKEMKMEAAGVDDNDEDHDS